jgi:hypothetical protein
MIGQYKAFGQLSYTSDWRLDSVGMSEAVRVRKQMTARRLDGKRNRRQNHY